MKEQRHLLISSQQKVDKEAGGRGCNHGALLGALGGGWKGHIYQTLLEEC